MFKNKKRLRSNIPNSCFFHVKIKSRNQTPIYYNNCKSNLKSPLFNVGSKKIVKFLLSVFTIKIVFSSLRNVEVYLQLRRFETSNEILSKNK